ncbi:sensor histidine kinase [Tenacibaculum xiamenense]|uniref:sensor histidine kinase n=1 Tax=Tenacibaculum xiamenense TaxID=1261553 RepID=UPI003895A9E7
MNTKLNRSDLYILIVYFVVSYIIQIQDYIDRDALIREYLIDFPIETFSICSTIFLFVFWLIPKIVKEKNYVFFAFVGILILIVFTGIDYTLGFWSGNNDWKRFPTGFDFILKMLDIGSRQVAFPFALLLTKKFYEGQNNLLLIEKQQKENELKLLRSQIDPHFLFNNLNTLDSLIDIDPEKAKEYINRLSLIYRYLIQTKDSEVMELSEELNFAENYIFLIKTRFENDYVFNVNSEGTDTTDSFLPTGAIQTLLENVVKHNKPNKTPIYATIKIDDKVLSIVNTKSDLKPGHISFGTGLDNLKIRYSHLSNKEILIINTEKEFKVTVPLIKLTN